MVFDFPTPTPTFEPEEDFLSPNPLFIAIFFFLTLDVYLPLSASS